MISLYYFEPGVEYVLQARVEAVQRQLERTDRVLKQIALDCGFGNADVMRRSFVRLAGVTPTNIVEL